ncbi:TonB-dependent receptor [Mucilaginibacter paludis]|nr:TonB-dependent receptor [Mucilaginibacter paludis]
MLLIALLFAIPLKAQTKGMGKELERYQLNLRFKAANPGLVFRTIESLTDLRFVYFDKDLAKIGPLTLSGNAVKLNRVLDQMLSGTSLTYRVNGLNVLIEPLKAEKNGKLTGKVVDDKGETLPGATIKIVESGEAALTNTEGVYSIDVKPGLYTVQISYVSFQTKRITGVAILQDKVTPLTVALLPLNNKLSEVTIVSDYKKESVSGLYARQKNSPSISNGISAEQIAATPDRNVGESLKRISGVSTFDNKYIVVRGISERYNAAMIDGTPMPSTDVSRRNFSFDLVPSNLIDNVVVVKTVTPDLNTGFGGGLVQINLKDVPEQSFMTFAAGSSYNDQTTGKDFYATQRGKYDYLGFDDGRRDFPALQVTYGLNNKVDAVAQSKLFTQDNFTTYRNTAPPSQNYLFTIGQAFRVGKDKQDKLGLIGSLSYRNTISNTEFTTERNPIIHGVGNKYDFNTTLGGLLNLAFQTPKHQFTLKNSYNRILDNSLYQTIGFTDDNDATTIAKGIPTTIRQFNTPEILQLLQNKITGQHLFNKLQVNWDFARVYINRDQKDVTRRDQALVQDLVVGTIYRSAFSNNPSDFPLSRYRYTNKETDYVWNLSGSLPFKLYHIPSVAKMGYFGSKKTMDFNWSGAQLITGANAFPGGFEYLSLADQIKPENFDNGYLVYRVAPYQLGRYNAKSNIHAGYAMLDNRLMDKLRLVWGVRAEYFDLQNLRNDRSAQEDYSTPSAVDTLDKKIRFLPSANLTYSLTSKINLRAAYSRSVIRPEFNEKSQFSRYDAFLNGEFTGSAKVKTTVIDSYDLRAEWFPGLGEVISIGGYYKYFDKPLEFVQRVNGTGYYYTYQNSVSAKNYGLEAEVRKNLSFIAPAQWLNNLVAYANITLIKSEVNTAYTDYDPQQKVFVDVASNVKRPLQGQSPYLLNGGLQYDGKYFGFNVVYNSTGRRLYFITTAPKDDNYETSRDQIDLQLNTFLIKRRLSIRLNAANLFNKQSFIYDNQASYTQPANSTAPRDFVLKDGHTDNYDPDDTIRFTQHYGRTYSITATYNF